MKWETYTIPLEEIKEYLKVEHDLEDRIIERIGAAAIQKARTETNERPFDKMPADLELAIFKTIAYWYENRSDQNNIPAEAGAVFNKYYLWPGL